MKTQSQHLKRMATLFALIGICAAGSAQLRADFMIDPNPGGLKFYNDVANKNVDHFFGNVGANNSGPVVRVDVDGNVDTGAGYSNIKPIKPGKNDPPVFLTNLLFTPEDPNLFGDFSFRGQLNDAAAGTVTLKVQDNQGGAVQTFTFTGLGGPNDFARIGIVAVAGSGETIKWVELISDFKEQKQTEFSYATAVPEPSTYIAGALLLLPIGASFIRRTRKVQLG